MAKDVITVRKGKVDSFNASTGEGKVKLASRKITFKSTNFRSGRPTRFPRAGESVEVVFAGGAAVSVRSVQD